MRLTRGVFVVAWLLAWAERERLLSWLVAPFVDLWGQHHPLAQPTLHFASPANLFASYLLVATSTAALAVLPPVIRQVWALRWPASFSSVGAPAAGFLLPAYAVIGITVSLFRGELLPLAFAVELNAAIAAFPSWAFSPTVLIHDYIELAVSRGLLHAVAAEFVVVTFFVARADARGGRRPNQLALKLAALGGAVCLGSALLMPWNSLVQAMTIVPLLGAYVLAVGAALLMPDSARAAT